MVTDNYNEDTDSDFQTSYDELDHFMFSDSETANINEFVTLDKTTNATKELCKWAMIFYISQSALRTLLKILRDTYDEKLILLMNKRTLMNTPRIINTIKVFEDGFEYWHQGVEVCLRNCFKALNNDKTIWININIDGLLFIIYL